MSPFSHSPFSHSQPKGAKTGSKLPELTKRTILMLKQAHPDWGCERISDMLLRGPALPASPNAVARVLKEAGYETVQQPTRPHPDHVRSFERAKPNQLWQTDLFTFVLKRQNRRVYLVDFLDDHSRFITGYGLHGSQSTPLVIEVVRIADVPVLSGTSHRAEQHASSSGTGVRHLFASAAVESFSGGDGCRGELFAA